MLHLYLELYVFVYLNFWVNKVKWSLQSFNRLRQMEPRGSSGSACQVSHPDRFRRLRSWRVRVRQTDTQTVHAVPTHLQRHAACYARRWKNKKRFKNTTKPAICRNDNSSPFQTLAEIMQAVLAEIPRPPQWASLKERYFIPFLYASCAFVYLYYII